MKSWGGKAVSFAQLSPFNNCISYCNMLISKALGGIEVGLTKILLEGESLGD